MKLKHEKKNFFCVDYDDLERLIYETYGVSSNYYRLPIDMEARNDSTLEFMVKKEVLDDYDNIRLQNNKKGEMMKTATIKFFILDYG